MKDIKLREGMFYNEDILIIKKNLEETIEVISDNASLLIITKKNLKDFFGENFRRTILFNCFLTSIINNKQVSQVFKNFIKVDLDIQNKLKDFYTKKEDEITKKRKKPGKSPSKSENIIEIISAYEKPNNKVLDLESVSLNNQKERSINFHQRSNSMYFRQNMTKQFVDYENRNIEMKELFKLFHLKFYKQGDVILLKKDSCVIVVNGKIQEVSFCDNIT